MCVTVYSASDLLQECNANFSQGVLEEERRGTGLSAADAIDVPSENADALHHIVRGTIILVLVLGVLGIVSGIALRLGCVPNWGDGDWRPSVPIVEVDLLLQRRKVPTTQATDALGVQPRAEKKPFRCDVDARWVPRGIVEGCFRGP